MFHRNKYLVKPLLAAFRRCYQPHVFKIIFRVSASTVVKIKQLLLCIYHRVYENCPCSSLIKIIQNILYRIDASIADTLPYFTQVCSIQLNIMKWQTGQDDSLSFLRIYSRGLVLSSGTTLIVLEAQLSKSYSPRSKIQQVPSH